MSAPSEQAPAPSVRPDALAGGRVQGSPATDGGFEALSPDGLVRRHQRLGWTALALFVALGMGLEALHAFKIGAYLNVDQTTRRFMWTLAHAHGTLIALVNLALAASLPRVRLPARRAALVSQLLMGATVLVPGGFFLGGLQFAGGDPGVGVLLVPIGGFLLVTALGLMAWATR